MEIAVGTLSLSFPPPLSPPISRQASVSATTTKGGPVLPPKRGAWMANKKNFMRGTDLSV